MVLIILSSFKIAFKIWLISSGMFFILNLYAAFQVTKYVTVEAERIPPGTCVCVSLTIIKTGPENFVVVQILKSLIIFRYCCNIVSISLLEAKKGKENSRW